MPSRLRTDPAFDHHMMQWLVVFSSSERARRAAEAWLATFEAARRAGCDESVAYARASGTSVANGPRPQGEDVWLERDA